MPVMGARRVAVLGAPEECPCWSINNKNKTQFSFLIQNAVRFERSTPSIGPALFVGSAARGYTVTQTAVVSSSSGV